MAISLVLGRLVHSTAVSVHDRFIEGPVFDLRVPLRRYTVLGLRRDGLVVLNRPTGRFEIEAIDHRGAFFAELKGEGELDNGVVQRFQREYDDTFSEIDREGGNSESETEGTVYSNSEDRELNYIYESARSYIHLDGRGRSRTFQAVFAFHRSTWLTMIVLGFLYGVQSILEIVVGGRMALYEALYRP